MVRFIGGFHSDEARGTFNKWLTYQRGGHGGKIPKGKVTYTAAQRNIRYWNYQGSHSWSTVFATEKAGWKLFGVSKKLPGYHFFWSTYIKKRLNDLLPFRDVEESDSFKWQYKETVYGWPIYGDIYQVQYFKER